MLTWGLALSLEPQLFDGWVVGGIGDGDGGDGYGDGDGFQFN